MSSRHLRRLKQSASLADATEDPSGDHDDDDNNDNSTPFRPTHANLFVLLSDDQPSEQASSEDEAVSTPDPPLRTDKNPPRKPRKCDQDWFVREEESEGEEAVPLLCNPSWHTVNLDGLDEAKAVRERIGSLSGQMKRPFGRLVAPRKSWPKVPAASLGFWVDQASESGGCKEYILWSSEKYNEKFHDLQVLISSADVAAVSLFVREHPEVVEGHLLMSDIMRQHSVADAASLTEFAIYLVEKSLPAGFSWASCRMRYETHPENRSVHLALFRHIQFLIRRASWRAALEVSKIVYNLDRSDPLLVVLLIDYILLHTKDVQVHDALCQDLAGNPKYPFLRYTSRVLRSNSDCFVALAEAHQVWSKADCKETFTHAVFKLYFARAQSHWKSASPPSTDLVEHDTSSMHIDDTLAVYRHGLLTDLPDIHLAYPSASALTLDPFPPTTDGVEYPGGRKGRDLLSTLSSMLNRLSVHQ